jgi:hypothetical protein
MLSIILLYIYYIYNVVIKQSMYNIQRHQMTLGQQWSFQSPETTLNPNSVTYK